MRDPPLNNWFEGKADKKLLKEFLKRIKTMPKGKSARREPVRKVSNKANLAALEVSNLIGSIVKGPRFQRHLNSYADNYELTSEERRMLLRRALRKFLGY